MSFWNAQRDKALRNGQTKGQSAAQIAKQLGTTRNAVIGRSHRLRRTVFQSEVARTKHYRSRDADRLAERQCIESAAIKQMASDLQKGLARPTAMARACKSGARWRVIGEYFDISTQAAQRVVSRALVR